MTSCNLANTSLCGVDVKHNSRLYSRFTDYLRLEGASRDNWINPHKAAHGCVLSNPSRECQQPLGKLLEGFITLKVEKKGVYYFSCISVCAHYEDNGKKISFISFKKWGQLIQKPERQKVGPSQHFRVSFHNYLLLF